MLRLRLLGAFDVSYGDQPLPKPPTLKSQSLLAYLVCYRQEPAPRHRLAELFWGDRPDYKARHSLATALWQIRHSLPCGVPGLGGEGYLLSDSHTVQFDPRAELWLDTEVFQSLLAQDHVPTLQSAVALYRGDFLDGFYDDWIINERYRLVTLYHAALARLMAGQESAGDIEAALSTALLLLQHDPLREDAHRLAMRAHCRLAQRNAALAQYRLCRQIVQSDLGTEPMAETTELYQAILKGRFAHGRHPIPAASHPSGVSGRPPSGRNPLDAISPTRLVGREKELRFLQECWPAPGTRRGRVVLLSGEAGVGKTRLVQDYAERLRWQGVRVLWGQCYEFERDLPYQPISEALRTVVPTLTDGELARCAPRAVAQAARLAPEILERLPGLQAAPPVDPSQDRAQLFDGIAGFLRDLVSAEALLFVVEDLHWAGESTLQMFHYLAHHLAGHPILMLATLRDEMVGRRHPLRELQRQLCREGLAQPLHLSRLAAEAVEAMIIEMSGGDTGAVPLAGRLYQETEGNPFFLIEIIKSLFEAELLRLERGSWQGDWAHMSQGELPLPASLGEAIRARVDALDDDVREALRLAAVLGREFDFDLLSAAWNRGEEAALEALDVLLRRRLLDEGSGPLGRDYAFTHHKIQEVVYSALPRRRRQHSHAQAGGAMERLRSATECDQLAGELAYHFEQARQLDGALTDKAVGYLLQAGDAARRLYAHRESIDYYRRALALLYERNDLERAARTLMGLGLTYHNAFDFRRADEAYGEGFVLWQRAASMDRPSPLLPAPDTLRTHWPDPPTLDPGRADTTASTELIEQLFSGLVTLSPALEILPEIARSWELSEGGRRYVFHLRDDALWSDGTPVTADDFEFAWKRVLDPRTQSRAAYLLYDVKGAQSFHQSVGASPEEVGVRALDRVTLAVELEAPTGYFLHLLAHTVTFPVPRHEARAALAHGPDIITNGPFRLESWHVGKHMVLARHPGYHGRFGGNLQRVELTLLPVHEGPTALELYCGGQLDILNLTWLPPAEMDPARQSHPTEYLRVPMLQTNYVRFDVERPPFDDIRVRCAFVLAADREALADVALRGYCLPATGGLVPPGMPGHSPDIGLPHDPDRARRLLADAGFPGGTGFPPVQALGLPAFSPHLRYLQTQWKETLGVAVLWQVADVQTLFDRLLSRAPHMLAVGHLADFPDPESFFRAGATARYLGWGHKECERLTQAAARLTDQPERIRLLRQADGLLTRESIIMPLTYVASHRLVKPWVTRYPTSSVDMQYWKDAVIEPH